VPLGALVARAHAIATVIEDAAGQKGSGRGPGGAMAIPLLGELSLNRHG
jgi:hypothetical protein